MSHLGCKTWVPLEEPVPTEPSGLVEVIGDQEAVERLASIRSALSG
jgi:hypothetical protein